MELQRTFADECELRPHLPLRVGIGLDAGEAVPVDGGFRGGPLNLASRLCARAAAGEVIVSQSVALLARPLAGLAFEDLGEVELKGMAAPVAVFRVAPDDAAELRAGPTATDAELGPARAICPRSSRPRCR